MNQLLLFHLGDSPYALEVGQIQEIVENPRIAYIPRAPSCFSGAINFHGTILPVLDLAGYLGYGGEGRDHRIIVLPLHLCPLAFSVSAVRRIVPFDPQALSPPMERRAHDSFARASLERDGEVVNLLDLTRLLASLEAD